MDINIPKLSLVLLMGPRGTGKSAFAARNFDRCSVISLDACRAMVSDDAGNREATPDAFDLARLLVAKRLARGLPCVVDARNLRCEHRKRFLAIAREQHVPSYAVVFLPRADRASTRTIRNMEQEIQHLEKERYHDIFLLADAAASQAARVRHETLRDLALLDAGPFDIIGDIHGCFGELTALLEKLGYRLEAPAEGPQARHPQGRKVVFLGDLVDRGPDAPSVLRLAINMTAAGNAWCVPGNHDLKLVRKLNGGDVTVSRGMAETLQQLEREPASFVTSVIDFFESLPSHYVFDGGRLVTAHAGLPARCHGRDSKEIWAFALYGMTTGEQDQYGLPVRLNWAADYEGEATVVYGHTALAEPHWENNTICIDSGCVYGGRLTALRYPERELVSVPSRRIWYPSAKPLFPEPGASGRMIG